MENESIFNTWCQNFNPRNLVELSKAFGEIEDRYAEEGRYYHTMTHIGKLFDEIHALPTSFVDIDILYHTALFHDVVYHPKSNCNEVRSAKYAANALGQLGVDIHKIQKVCDLIKATENHDSLDVQSQWFNDMDLIILGSSPSIYYEYTQQIRQEYAHIPGPVYRFYRKRFLEKMMAKPGIYKTQYYFEKYEAKALRNMTKELESMK